MADIEEVATDTPDLVIGPEGNFGGDLDLWQGVAPSVETPDIGWREILRIVSEATGREEAALAIETEIEAELATFDADLAAVAPSLAFVFAAADGGALTFNSESPLNQTLVAAGLQPLEDPGPTSQPGGNAYSEEELGSIEAEAIIVIDALGTGLAQLEASPLWETLPAVRAGNVIAITLFDAALMIFDSVLTIPLQLDLLERLLPQLAS